MTETDLMEQLLSISSTTRGYNKNDTIMMNKGFREARNQSMSIVKDYLAKNGLLVDETNRL